jgi:hypothetical protein
LVSRLAAAGGLALRDVPSKKGSTWVLSFASDEQEMADQFDQKPAKHVGLRLVAADYIPDPLP